MARSVCEKGAVQKPAWTSRGPPSVSEELSINSWETHGMNFQWGPCVELEIRWEREFLVCWDQRRTWFIEAIKPEGSRRSCWILPLAYKPISSETQTGCFTCELCAWLLHTYTPQRARSLYEVPGSYSSRVCSLLRKVDPQGVHHGNTFCNVNHKHFPRDVTLGVKSAAYLRDNWLGVKVDFGSWFQRY